MQRFLERGGSEVQRGVADAIRGRALPLSLQMYGCRVVQKALEVRWAAALSPPSPPSPAAAALIGVAVCLQGIARVADLACLRVPGARRAGWGFRSARDV